MCKEIEVSKCGGLKRQMTPKLLLTISLGSFFAYGIQSRQTLVRWNPLSFSYKKHFNMVL